MIQPAGGATAADEARLWTRVTEWTDGRSARRRVRGHALDESNILVTAHRETQGESLLHAAVPIFVLFRFISSCLILCGKCMESPGNLQTIRACLTPASRNLLTPACPLTRVHELVPSSPSLPTTELRCAMKLVVVKDDACLAAVFMSIFPIWGGGVKMAGIDAKGK